MLLNLSEKNKISLLELFRQLLSQGAVPTNWKLASLIPLPKQGASKSSADGYRPVALTSNLCKLLEGIVGKRISWLLENKSKILPTQMGFRQNGRTVEDLLTLDHYVKDAWQQKKLAYGISSILRRPSIRYRIGNNFTS